MASQPGSDAARGFAAFTNAHGKSSVQRRTLVCRTATPHVGGNGVEIVGLRDVVVSAP